MLSKSQSESLQAWKSLYLVVLRQTKDRKQALAAVRRCVQMDTVIKTCTCGHVVTTENSEYIGEMFGLKLYNCASCKTTIATK